MAYAKATPHDARQMRAGRVPQSALRPPVNLKASHSTAFPETNRPGFRNYDNYSQTNQYRANFANQRPVVNYDKEVRIFNVLL